jgi:hypothetical protein
LGHRDYQLLRIGKRIRQCRGRAVGYHQQASPNVNINLNVNLSGKSDLVFVTPNYTFATPVFGGQLGVSLGVGAGPSSADLNGTLTATVGPFTATRQGEISETRGGVSDL